MPAFTKNRPHLILTVMLLFAAVQARPADLRAVTVELEDEGWVAAREASARGGTRLRIAVQAIDGLAPERTPPAVRVTVRAGGDEIGVGDAVTMLARLRPPAS